MNITTYNFGPFRLSDHGTRKPQFVLTNTVTGTAFVITAEDFSYILAAENVDDRLTTCREVMDDCRAAEQVTTLAEATD